MATELECRLSRRGGANIKAIIPQIKDAIQEKKKKNTANIDLATAENWLIRSEIVDICKSAIAQELVEKHLSYPRGLTGDPDLVEAFAIFFNKYFNPHRPVQPQHVAAAPGASSCIDSLLYNICDPGEGVLIPGPYWNGFDIGFRLRSSVVPVLVTLSSFNASFTDELIPALEEAINTAGCPIKALIITNPHNPLALCYPKSILEDCLRFCKRHGIHFISDEVYALSRFKNPEIKEPVPFVSALSLDAESIGGDGSRLHVVWSLSKDFGQSGFRMGCVINQGDAEMIFGVALAANNQISSLSAICATNLLNSPRLSRLISTNSDRLLEAYTKLTSFLKEQDIPYIPCDAGLYVLARLAPNAETWDDEADMIMRFKRVGVLVSPGRAYHGPDGEKGWMRVLFSVQPDVLSGAIERMKGVSEKYRMEKGASRIDSKVKRPIKETDEAESVKRARI
ncbi:1-aminocyclopropane-1-carboxylate synthase 7 [Delitschia confertaspora ATCC 74209]|uniref:1-aminocyclopropane-1-carboxylate synthase 7 n=1 Tax=Delitschia confertaspora ATCC 74209 TaxID=1513339 RepID=A0A9P4JRR9_9PLEO|nr:1-aminocyclopropane-1-carboxylate synthase 7 [Delitschia confertaspora ATCC 74209]